MTKFSDTHEFPFSADTVLTHYTCPDFLARKYAALGREQVEVLEHHAAGDERRLQLRYLEPTASDRLPDFAQKFLRAQTVMQQTTHWDLAARSGRIELDPEGPARMHCQLRIEDIDGGSRLSLDWEIKVSVPLVGGKLEKVLMQGMQEKSRNDERVSRELMAAG